MIKKKKQISLPEKNRKSEREQHGKIAKDNELDCGLFGNIGRLPYYNTHTIFHLVMVLPINKKRTFLAPLLRLEPRQMEETTISLLVS